MSTFVYLRARQTRAALLCLVIAASLLSAGALGLADAAAANGPQVARDPQAASKLAASVSKPIQRAKAALATAESRLERGRYTKALAALKSVRYNGWRAHKIGMSLIGKPPTDPESDEPPGPPAVIAVTNLEHRVTMRLVPFFNGQRRNWVVEPLRETVRKAVGRRHRMLNKVIALPAEGKRGDYDDSMSDTLGTYRAEKALLTNAIQTYQLTDRAATGLRTIRAKVRKTSANVNRVWGGGE